MAQPEQFMEPGMGPDYRIGSDGLAATNGWRRITPPPGEDGTVPDVSLTVTGANHSVRGGGVLPIIPRQSTFDLPIG
jgi:hypothetical protein